MTGNATTMASRDDRRRTLSLAMPAHALRRVLISSLICEQAHQQLKEELGLDHFEGRSWRGLHRHALMTSSREKVPSWRVDLSMVGPPIDVSRGPFNFWKTTPYKVVFGCASCAPRQGETGFAFPIVKFHPGSSCPQAAALRQSHTRGRRPRHFRAIYALVGIRSTFAVRI